MIKMTSHRRQRGALVLLNVGFLVNPVTTKVSWQPSAGQSRRAGVLVTIFGSLGLG
jgi:hypothetical protein